MRTKTNDMSTIKIPHNGLPQEIATIPFGQVIVLTDPNQGITSKTIKTVEFIHSVARKLNQKRHIVNSLPVDAADLCGCVICKVKTDDGVQILVSDWNSLLEMLCVFWGLDYEEVCKIPDIIPGWHKTHKGVTIGGESHPVRIPLKPLEGNEPVKDDYGITLQLIQPHTKTDELLGIKKAIQNSFYHNLDISIDDIINLYEDVKKSIKTYHLDIHIDRDESGKICCCDISLKDNFGKLYPLKQIEHQKEKHLEPQIMAFYLTFILFKEGKKPLDVDNDDFYETLIKIQSQLPYRFRKPKKDNLTWNVYSKKSVIRKSIWNATHDSYAQEQFSIDGYGDDVFRVAGATDDDREKIKKEFGLE